MEESTNVTNIRSLLDQLKQEFENKDYKVSLSLQDGLTREEILNKTKWFNCPLPDELIQLYEWRNGQSKDSWQEKYPFVFRDNQFCSLERAKQIYHDVVVLNSITSGILGNVDYMSCFPIAEFNGECFLYPCKGVNNGDQLKFPIIDLNGNSYFYSFSKMLQTCIDWVKNSKIQYGALEINGEIETEIWENHNPNIFSSWV